MVIEQDSQGIHPEVHYLRFIPEGYKVPRVLIHLLSHFLRRHGLWLCILFIATTVTSASVSFASKVLHHRKFVRFPCVMLKRWPLIL